MRLRALAATAVLVLAGGLSTGLPAAAAPAPHPAAAASGPHSDQCFGKGHRDGAAKPGATCWEGAICIITNNGDHVCMSTASRSGVHIVTMNDHPKKDLNDWEAKLVGYVKFSMHHGHDWPNLGNPLLNRRFAGFPVMNIHLVTEDSHHHMHFQKDVCIGGVPAAAGLPAQAEVTGYAGGSFQKTCSPVGQGKPNTHDTFMIWHPGLDTKSEPYLAKILIVNYTAGGTEGGVSPILLTAADGSGNPEVGVFDEVWYVTYHKDLSEQQDWYRVLLHH